MLRFRACTVGRTGELRDTVSLLDDFEAAPDVPARLALLPRIAAVYSDDELPPEVRYLLALSLLRPHLVWRHVAPIAGDETLEVFLRQDAELQLQSAQDPGAKSNRVEAILQNDSGPHFAWSLKDPSDSDVGRARQLLKGLSSTSFAKSAERWLAGLDGSSLDRK